jgi:hypothetical protein
MPIGEKPMIQRFLDNRLTDGGDVVKPYPPASLYPTGRFLVLVSVRGLVDVRAILRLDRLGKLKKKSFTSPGLEPATFWLVE